MLEHGGGIIAAARRYGIPERDWLDLSTGLNPHGWPVPALPADAWQRLPETNDGLEQAAARYYGSAWLLPVAGSQAAIQTLPLLRAPGTVGLLNPSYAEHAYAWERRGHQVQRFAPSELDAAVNTLDVLLLCNPNNPTGQMFTPEQLESWRQRLAMRGGWLVVDEAFMDCTPQFSILNKVGAPGLIVLRSVGKFFGLAGVRAGFVFAWRELLDALQEELGPWAVSGPARAAVKLALQDMAWQQQTRVRLAADGERLASLLSQYGLPPHGGCVLFQWLAGPHTFAAHTFLAERGILTRYFAEPESIRFGLPTSEADWQRLETALAAYLL